MTEPAAFDPETIDPACFTTPLSLTAAQQLVAAPIAVDADRSVLRVAVLDPNDLTLIDDLALAAHPFRLEPVAATRAEIDTVLRRWSRIETQARDAATVSEITADVVEEAAAADDTEQGKVTSLVVSILNAGAEARASDIHFEPTGGVLTVRFRVDGVLRVHQTLPRAVAGGVINRVKVMAGIDVAERRLLQDGRFTHRAGGRILDCRVVTVPTASRGEGAVVRLLDQGRTRLSLEDLGFSAELREQFTSLLESTPNGTVLVTGPTGAGKTTTLYAALEIVARSDRKTLAIEDPVEVTFESITQVQVNEAAGLTFAAALRGFLRADPDVMLVGEIRDAETAKLATESALTGHLVLSTLHTNDAAGAPPRLADLGVESFLTASSLRAVLSQRLMRRLCTCATTVPVSGSALDAVRWPDTVDRPTSVREPQGCNQCDHTGYLGRLAVGELIVIDDTLAEAITARVSSTEIARLASEAGTVPLRDQGAAAVVEGVTSLAELTRAGL